MNDRIPKAYFLKKAAIFKVLLLFLLLAGCRSVSEIREISPRDLCIVDDGGSCRMLVKNGFLLGYSEEFRQSLWSSYHLTSEKMRAERVPRTNRFRTDRTVANQVRPQDYRGSGFDRGHLVPAADMAYSEASMEDSFLMTNISPQYPRCNRGVWAALENSVRKIAAERSDIIVISGPLFSADAAVCERIDLHVPSTFYKIVMELDAPCAMHAYLVENGKGDDDAVIRSASVDEIEEMTGYDFFSVLDDETENILESRKISVCEI